MMTLFLPLFHYKDSVILYTPSRKWSDIFYKTYFIKHLKDFFSGNYGVMIICVNM